jgi:hypothetical protein
VVAHETIGKTEPVDCLLHDRQEGLPVLVVFKNRQAGVTSGGDVIECTGGFTSKRSGNDKRR